MKILKRLKFVWISLLVLIFIRVFIIDNYVITSGSMRGTLQEGDYVIVSKLSYGPRIPPVLKIPFADYDGPLFRILNFSPYIQLHRSDLRIHLGDVQRNDIIAFDPPNKAPDRSSLYVPFIKRCVGIAGDTVSIQNGRLNINGHPSTIPYQKEYLIRLNNSNDINKVPYKAELIDKYNNIFKVSIRSDKIVNLRKHSEILDVKEDVQPDNFADMDVFPFSLKKPSNRDNIKSFRIPFSNMEISLNPETFSYYQELINLYEGDTLIQKTDGSYAINDIPAEYYTFKQNYYFAIGDNWDNSIDSRFWGLFPERFIHGKVTLLWFSKSDKINWNRAFTKV